jgi:hypothetical protein
VNVFKDGLETDENMTHKQDCICHLCLPGTNANGNLTAENVFQTELEKIHSKYLHGPVRNGIAFVVPRDSQFAFGQMLREVRGRRLYKQHYKTFELYCSEQFGISRSRAYQLMNFAEMPENVRTYEGTIRPRPVAVSPYRKLAEITAQRDALLAAAKLTVQHFERQLASDVFLGDDEHECLNALRAAIGTQ